MNIKLPNEATGLLSNIYFKVVMTVLTLGFWLIFILKINEIIARKIYNNPEVKTAIFNIYKDALETKNKKIKVTPAEYDKNLMSIPRFHPGIGIPGDARIVEFYQSIRIDDKNGFSRIPMFARWRWVRSNGKSTQVYYKNKIYIATWGFNKRLNKFRFKIEKDTLFKRNSSFELENEYFNKEFIYKHNDPIALRRVLTPYSQEQFIENLKKDRPLFRTMSMIKDNDSTIVSSWTVPSNLRIFTIRAFPVFTNFQNKDSIAKHIIKDTESDIDIVRKTYTFIDILKIK